MDHDRVRRDLRGGGDATVRHRSNRLRRRHASGARSRDTAAPSAGCCDADPRGIGVRPMPLAPELFVAELDAQNRAALDRIAVKTSAGEPDAALTVARLLMLALKNELEATECA